MRAATLLSVLATVLVTTTTALAQEPESDLSTPVPVRVDSGLVANTTPGIAAIGVPEVVWSTVVSVPDSAWLRLRYAGVLLSGKREPGGDGSFLRLTSLLDGGRQTQHLVHVGQWQDTSAYFNGDSVLVELLACPGTGDNRLQIFEVLTGPALPGMPDTICGPTDDRQLSTDPRAGRNQPGGCTSWLIDDCNHCFLTAGHCAGSLQVVQFNVPLSTGSGALQHPGPQHQYALDPASLQTNGGLGVGNDYAYFGVFPNSTTLLTPFQANGGQTYSLLNTPPAVAGQQIRITGYGSTGSPVSPTWNQVQKTHAGPYASFSGTTVQYATDTTGGNSGSPIFLDGTNVAIGIHTHGGCSATSGANSGTGSNLAALQQALADPQGVCDCPELEFAFPNGLPASVQPDGSTTIRVQITGVVALQPGTLVMVASTFAGQQTLQPTPAGANLFDFTMPATLCGTLVPFWFTAQGVNSVTYTSPEGAPSAQHSTIAANAITSLRNYDFNTAPPGWTVVNTSLATGAWVRGTPIDSRGPATDFDGSGQCWVTGNVNNEDVDGGPTSLVTETVDLSSANDPTVHFAVWFENSTPEDRLRVDISNNGGLAWTTVFDLAPFSDWSPRSIRVRDVFASPANVALRFVTADQPNNSVTEAALDAFRIDDFQCTTASWSAFGAGCSAAGSAPDLALVSVPTLGATFALNVTGLGSGFPFMIVGLAGENLPLSLPEFAPGCTLLARLDLAQFVPASGGVAPWSLTLPLTPTLSGVRVWNQALELGTPWTMSRGGVGEVR
jgi:V8-like Glu-specific endopeptidase